MKLVWSKRKPFKYMKAMPRFVQRIMAQPRAEVRSYNMTGWRNVYLKRKEQ